MKTLEYVVTDPSTTDAEITLINGGACLPNLDAAIDALVYEHLLEENVGARFYRGISAKYDAEATRLRNLVREQEIMKVRHDRLGAWGVGMYDRLLRVVRDITKQEEMLAKLIAELGDVDPATDDQHVGVVTLKVVTVAEPGDEDETGSKSEVIDGPPGSGDESVSTEPEELNLPSFVTVDDEHRLMSELFPTDYTRITSAVMPEIRGMQNLTSMREMFAGMTSLDKLTSTMIASGGEDTSGCRDFVRAFANCSSLTSIPGFDYSGIATEEDVRDMLVGTQVTNVEMRNVPVDLREVITSELLKGDDSLVIDLT